MMDIHLFKRTDVLILISAVVAITAVTITFLISGSLEFSISIAGIVAFLVFSPYAILIYIEHRKVKAIEERFPDFLRDISESVASGTTLPKAIMSASMVNYGALTPEIKKMANQLSWGIPFPKVVKSFSRRMIRSPFIRRSVVIIIEAYKSGGDISKVVSSVAESAGMIKTAEKERAAKMYQQMMISYAIFFVFIGIVVMLSKVIYPILALGEIQTPFIAGTAFSEEYYKTLFRHLLLIQGLFTGLIAGQVGEGSIKAGIKHSIIMVLSALLITWVLI